MITSIEIEPLISFNTIKSNDLFGQNCAAVSCYNGGCEKMVTVRVGNPNPNL